MSAQRRQRSTLCQALPKPTSLSCRRYMSKWFLSQNTHWKGSVTKAGRGKTQGCILGSTPSYRTGGWSRGCWCQLKAEWTLRYRQGNRSTIKTTGLSGHSSSEGEQLWPPLRSQRQPRAESSVLGAQIYNYKARCGAKKI